jgi:hypothetical protein
MTRHYRPCIILAIATTQFASVVCLALALAWLPRLPVAGAHVTPLEGGSPVGGHGDVFSGGSSWTVTGPLY